jgi:uncharacterized membrane protein YhaH (DUF805 family)
MLNRLLRFWFTFGSPVTATQYLEHGAALIAIKYATDMALVKLAGGGWWSPLDYMHSLSTLQNSTLAAAPPWLMPLLAVWSLPFLWIGITLSVRRAIDAGRSPWFALCFFVPYLNYTMIAAFCVLPSRAEVAVKPEVPLRSDQIRYMNAMLPGMLLGLVTLGLAVYYRNTYSAALFFATPFGVGALTAYVLNRYYLVSTKQTTQLVLLTLGALAGVLFIFGREGAICIAMAIPLSVVVGVMGGTVGRRIALAAHTSLRAAAMSMLVFPTAALMEPRANAGTTLHEVRSAVEIAAPAMTVWSQVVAFPPMPEPDTWFFRLGIAYPKYARIEGSGIGAVRYCVFSTGPFVEPITVWEPGRKLAFTVRSSPVPLRELTPYDNVMPPHLRGFLQSRQGEFRLIALPNGHTRLEGSTWYTLQMGPEGYWQLFGDYLIHRIHLRVLEHIKAQSESIATHSLR